MASAKGALVLIKYKALRTVTKILDGLYNFKIFIKLDFKDFYYKIRIKKKIK